jgi:hypothetical protein
MAIKTVEYADTPALLQAGDSCEVITHAGGKNQASGSVHIATRRRYDKFLTDLGGMGCEIIGE